MADAQAQAAILCEEADAQAQAAILCEEAVKRLNDTCQVNLCLPCVPKHKEDKCTDHKRHDIVTFENKVQQREGLPSSTCDETHFQQGQTSSNIGKNGQQHAAEVIYTRGQELLDNAEVIRTIRPSKPYKPLRRMVCVGPSEAWVSGDKDTIKRVEIHGSIKEKVKCPNKPFDITMTIKGELIYTDNVNRTVNVVRHGTIETLINAPPGWEPLGICCSRSGKILVSLQRLERNKIACYMGMELVLEIEYDEQSKHIFENGNGMLDVTTNNNGDICVADRNAKNVVVIDRSGRVRFRYNGKAASGRKTFSPRCIVTDPMGHIIFTDVECECLHILNQNGTLLRIVGNCGLDTPCAVSVDGKGRLWVGLYHTGKIKVIRYLK